MIEWTTRKNGRAEVGKHEVMSVNTQAELLRRLSCGQAWDVTFLVVRNGM